MNSGGRGSGQRRNKRERLRHWEMRQLTKREGRNMRQSCDERWRHDPPRSIFMAPAVGGVAHGSVNVRALAEWARTAPRQKKAPWPLTPIVSPGFRVTNFRFLFGKIGKIYPL
jgi:hypothetical protein